MLVRLGMLYQVAGCGDAGGDVVYDASGAAGAGGNARTEGDFLVLRRPDPETRERAERIREVLPGARLHFSQRTGHLMMVQGPSVVDAENPAPPKPLAITRGVTEEAMAATLLDYFVRFEDVFGIKAPEETLRLPKESIVGTPPPDANQPLTHLQQPAERISVHLTHTHQGLPVQGRYATGLFDDEGNLRAVLTRLLELPEDLNPVPTLSGDEAMDLIFAEMPMMVEADPALIWLAGTPEVPEAVKLLFWYPKDRTGESVVLAHEIEMRKGPERARFVVDAHTGELLFAGSALPTDWHDDGDFETTPAPDEQGNMLSIPSSVFEAQRYMGYGSNQTGTRFFRAGQGLFIGDVSNQEDRSAFTFEAIQITTEGGNDWLSDPEYNTAHQFAATRLMDNLTKIMQWWAQRGWPGWDGRGSTLVANVGVNKLADTSIPHLNAWGSGGYLQIGDGLTPGGWYLSASAETVGHEFTHNVISVTSELAYRHESGALNEALADIFGAAMTATDDRLSSDWYGDDADPSSRTRSLRDPTLSSQPDRYSRYRVMTRDAGGVHFNSGIFNKAHYLVMQGGTFNGVDVPAQGVSAPIEVLRQANALVSWDPDTSMEEFAAGVIGYCDLIDALARALGDEGSRETCDAFFRAYRAVELLQGAGGVDLAVDSVQIGADGNFEVVVANRGRVAVVPNDRFELLISDPLGGGIVAWRSPGFGRALDPADTVTVPTGVSADFLNPFTRSDTVTISAEIVARDGIANPDVDTSNNTARVEIGPDLVPLRLIWSEGTDAVEVFGEVTNLGRTAYTEDLSAVILVRETATGALSVFEGVDVSLADDGGRPTRVDSSAWSGITFPAPRTVAVEGSVIMPRQPISGTSRFPGTSPSTRLLQAWYGDEGGLPELEDRFQIYLFVDPYDLVAETDETNNLLCANCRRSGDAYGTPVVVYLPEGVDTDAMFPAPYRAAAAKLKSERPMLRVLERFERSRLSPYVGLEPVIELP
jgi:thermolysin